MPASRDVLIDRASGFIVNYVARCHYFFHHEVIYELTLARENENGGFYAALSSIRHSRARGNPDWPAE
jgi:hypothetical protein